jgi:hypothetical protein
MIAGANSALVGLRVAPDPIFSIPPDPDRISEVESGRSRIRIPGVVDNGTLIIKKKTQNINLNLYTVLFWS